MGGGEIPPRDSSVPSDIKHRVLERLGSTFTVDVEIVREIPRTSAGKFLCQV